MMSDLKYVNNPLYLCTSNRNYVIVIFSGCRTFYFLRYLAEWDEMVEGRNNINAAEKWTTLSKDTLHGLRMTGQEELRI